MKDKSGRKKLAAYIAALRLERWARSLAIIPGCAAFYVLHQQSASNLSLVRMTAYFVIAYMLTFFISIANYIINEIIDSPYDAYHPRKKNRPLIKREVNVRILMLLWTILAVIALLLSYTLLQNIHLFFALLALLLAGLLYNVPPARIKDIPYLDTLLESANNPIRFLIGWYIFTASFPPLSLLCSWWAFGCMLMTGKRLAEKKFLTPRQSAGYRLALYRYSMRGLQTAMLASGAVTISFFACFIYSAKLYSYFYLTPFILFYLIMIIKKSHKDFQGAEEPEKLLKDPIFAASTLLLLLAFILMYIVRQVIYN